LKNRIRVNDKLTGRQHCGAPNLEKPPALMRGKAFQKPPRRWRLGELIDIIAFTNMGHKLF